MSTSTAAHRPRPPVLVRLALAALVLVLLPAAAAAAPPATRPDTAASQSQRQVTVMTRNLYLGASLTPLLTGGNPAEVLQDVILSDPPLRMAEVAEEIAAADPTLVGVQEASYWEIPTPAGTVTYDFTALLLAALADLGEPYSVAISQTNIDLTVPPEVLGAPVRFADRDVILVRDDARTAQARIIGSGGDHFEEQASFGTFLGDVEFTRGYVWVDVRTRGRTWRFANTHLEAFPQPISEPPGFRDLTGPQATELLDALDVDLPVVLVGDINSAPDDPFRLGYATLIEDGGLVDAWSALRPDDPGYTCCFDDTLTGGELTERIDVVLTLGRVDAVAVERVGVAPFQEERPQWASDHAGVLADLVLGRPG